jgi:uncharacterized protein YrrD
MLHSMKDLEGYTIGALDGTIGRVKDLYFDDQSWVIRYLVVETGTWLFHRRVLISPLAINEPNWSEKIFPTAITQEQVRSSPNIDTEKPVSRQHEMAYLGYYGYPHYWGGGDFWGDGMMMWGMKSERAIRQSRPADAAQGQADPEANTEGRPQGEAHLRSGNEIVSYDVLASDGHIGHVEHFLVDESGWAIRYLVVNTDNWWFGHHVLIAPQWVTGVRWDDRQVSVGLTRDAVRDSRPYSPGDRVGRGEEARIFEHYNRPGYWAREVQLENPEMPTLP